MTIADVSDEIYRELLSPSSLSIPSISFWLRSNIGAFNTLTFNNFELNDTSFEFDPTPSEEEKSILKRMYFIFYYDTFIRSNLGAASFDSVLELTSDGGTVRMTNRNEIAKTYLALKKQEQSTLDRLLLDYKASKSTARDVSGDDVIEGFIRSEFQPRAVFFE